MRDMHEAEIGLLQTICYYEEEESTKSFVLTAYQELNRRGVKPLHESIDSNTLEQFEDQYQELNKEWLKQNSFSVIELIWIGAFFFKELLGGTNVLKEETKKRKQRLYAIVGGVICYSLLLTYVSFKSEKDNQDYVSRLQKEVYRDSVFKSVQDWSGVYAFNESENDRWVLEINKENGKHFGVLKINKSDHFYKLQCSIEVREFGIQIFPDSTMPGLKVTSIRQVLFDLEVDDGDTLTWWGVVKPKDFELSNGTKAFRLIN